MGPLGSKTSPHGPKTPPNPDFWLICVPSGLIFRRFLGHIFKKYAMFLLIGVHSGMHFFNKTLNIGNEANKWVGARPTFLARWRGCRRQLDTWFWHYEISENNMFKGFLDALVFLKTILQKMVARISFLYDLTNLHNSLSEEQIIERTHLTESSILFPCPAPNCFPLIRTYRDPIYSI